MPYKILVSHRKLVGNCVWCYAPITWGSIAYTLKLGGRLICPGCMEAYQSESEAEHSGSNEVAPEFGDKNIR